MTLQVFISYKSEYRDFARAVKSELNQWGFDTWLDVDNIQPGDYFRHKIQAGLDSSDVLLMVLTEEAQLSREVMSEVDYFLDVAKKPVVPLRHRECKPLYIFVSIQYIDFVTDQANGFVQLKQRLNELAQSTVDSTSGDTLDPELIGGKASEAEEAIVDDFLREKSDQKKEVLEDGLFGAPTLSEIEAPKPQPAPPPPIIQPPSSPITSSPATPILQPPRHKKGAAREAIDIFRQLQLLVTDDSQAVETAFQQQSRRNQQLANSPSALDQKEAKDWDKAAATLRNIDERDALIHDIYEDFCILADAALMSNLNNPGGGILTQQLANLMLTIARDQFKVTPPLAQRFLVDYLRERGLRIGELLVSPENVSNPPANVYPEKVDLSWQQQGEYLPQPVPPPPIIQPPSSPITSMPATPILQPSRQQEYMPQPAALGRKRSSPILWSLAAVASLIIVVGAVVLFSSSANISLTTQLPQETSPLVWVGVVIVLGVIGVFGWRRFNVRKGLRPFPTDDTQNRATMLQNVEDFWLKGVLDPALEAGTLDIGLSSAPGAVLRHKDYGDYELPANANILDVFNDLNRELLILGAPGGGKTVLLLQLARELIGQAKNPTPQSPPRKQGGEEPIPVVFNLSSWVAERKPLGDWLVDELRQKYQVPKKVAMAWVEGEKLLPLLDGLDEVAEQYRNECVEAINIFRNQYRTVDLAVCSRVADYESLTSKLDVRGAIVLEPLSQQVIDKYLDRPELVSLRQVMATDKALQEMSEVPFLLNAMAYAYAGATASNLQFSAIDNLVKARRTHLFDRWVEKRLVARPNDKYTPSNVPRWLGWLAVKLKESSQTTFYMERLQPSWLTTKSSLLLYRAMTALITGTLLGLLFDISLNNAQPFKFGLIVSVVAGIILGIFVMSKSFEGGIAFGFLSGLLIFMSIGSGTRTDASGRATTPVVFESPYGLYLGIVICLIIFFFTNTRVIYKFQSSGWVWNWGRFCIGTVIALVIAFITGLTQVPTAVFFSALTGGIIFALLPTSKDEVLSEDIHITRPTMKSQFIHMLNWALLIEVLFVATPVLGFGYDPDAIWAIIKSGFIAVGIFVLTNGGLFVFVQKFALYLVLCGFRNVPLSYPRLLDYCASAGIMRKVGGGYIFAHRYLMEYFAESASNN